MSKQKLSRKDSTQTNVAIVDLVFLGPLPNECRCSMCEQLLQDPCHLTCCGARYCRKCVDRLLISHKSCARQKCKSKHFRAECDEADEAVGRLALSLHVYCPMKEARCLWTGGVESVGAHLRWGEYESDETTSCRYLQVPCPDCGEHIARRDMPEHHNVRCGSRRVRCNFCDHVDVAATMEAVHSKQCALRRVDCTNGCGMRGVTASGLPRHLAEECPLRVVSCEHFGCDATFSFKDRFSHDESCVYEHLRVTSEAVRALVQENKELRSLVLKVQEDCDKLFERCDNAGLFLLAEQQRQRQQQVEDELDKESPYLVIAKKGASLPGHLKTGGGGGGAGSVARLLQLQQQVEARQPTIHKKTDSMRREVSSPNFYQKKAPAPPRFSDLLHSNVSLSPDSGDTVVEANVLPLPPRSKKSVAESGKTSPPFSKDGGAAEATVRSPPIESGAGNLGEVTGSSVFSLLPSFPATPKKLPILPERKDSISVATFQRQHRNLLPPPTPPVKPKARKHVASTSDLLDAKEAEAASMSEKEQRCRTWSFDQPPKLEWQQNAPPVEEEESLQAASGSTSLSRRYETYRNCFCPASGEEEAAQESPEGGGGGVAAAGGNNTCTVETSSQAKVFVYDKDVVPNNRPGAVGAGNRLPPVAKPRKAKSVDHQDGILPPSSGIKGDAGGTVQQASLISRTANSIASNGALGASRSTFATLGAENDETFVSDEPAASFQPPRNAFVPNPAYITSVKVSNTVYQ